MEELFQPAEGMREAGEVRQNVTRDIFERRGVLSPSRIILRNYPVPHPLTAFNAGARLAGEELYVYPRIVLGYYKYVSSIVELRIPLEDLEGGGVSLNSYVGDVVVTPSTRFDIWGAEDPRVYSIGGRPYMTYTGRTLSYFDPEAQIEKTLPVTAVREAGRWEKRLVFKLPQGAGLVSDKDAFLCEVGERLYLFHRPHLLSGSFHLVVSMLDDSVLTAGAGLREVEVQGGFEVLRPAPFESKLGWAAPPLQVGAESVVALVHAVDREGIVYRVFAVRLKLSARGVAVEAVTPHYIMEPRAPYEVVGDRPYTIFPCGLVKVGDEVLITYGAGDYVVGFAAARLDELLASLEEGELS